SSPRRGDQAHQLTAPTGYPGLAPGPPDRPHASVKGTLEIRSQQPLKVKWVHMELKKIESVPGSPPFVDLVGSKPTVLWEPQNSEFGILQSENIQFDIRIPESIPPTVVLDNGRGLLRKETSPLSTASCEVVILKHELHSTWPVYAQPEVRETRRDGLTLVVSRKRTCLGSG
ncbi:1860_t:CDS:2, partial [Acaulospora colombiana]